MYSINLELRNNVGNTALWLALSQLNSTRGESDKFAAKLIERGSNPDAVDTRTGNALLHLASLERNERAAIFLVCHGAKVNHVNHHGEAPIHIASSKGLHNLIQVLLQYGADPNLQTNLKPSPLNAPLVSIRSQTPPSSRGSPLLISPTSTIGALTALSNIAAVSSTSLERSSPLLVHNDRAVSNNPFDDDDDTTYRVSSYRSNLATPPTQVSNNIVLY